MLKTLVDRVCNRKPTDRDGFRSIFQILPSWSPGDFSDSGNAEEE